MTLKKKTIEKLGMFDNIVLITLFIFFENTCG